MRKPIRFLPEAREEFDHSIDFYDSRRPGTGAKFMRRVTAVLKSISANPLLHMVIYRGVRRGVVKKFPFVVLYLPLDTEILVISVFHTSRDPDIWKARLD